jgi:prolyl 4-hydroxylase
MPEPFDLVFKGVLALFNTGRLAEATTGAAALIGEHPASAPAYNLQGVIQATAGDADAAAASFRKAAALKSDWDEPHSNLGLLLSQRQDYAGAAESFRAALKLKPGNAGIALNLGNVLRELGALEDATACYRQALAGGGPQANDPHKSLAHNNLGAMLLTAGKAEEAAAAFRRALALQPDFADAHLNLARALRRAGQLEDALTHVIRATELAPNSASGAVVMGNILRDLGRLEDAAQAYSRAIELKPADHEAGYNRGQILNDLGRHAEGLSAFARGPGIVKLRVAPGSTTPPPRLDLGAGAAPTFIGAWKLDEPGACDDIISFFERHSGDHTAGRSAVGLNAAIKNSTDLTVLPCDLDKPGFAPIKAYIRHLESCLGDYGTQWSHFAGMLAHVDVGPFNIQHYRPGGHFQHIHAERMSFGFIHRVLAWMTYLNDVDDGGETTFHHYGLNVRPERGKTLIWPAEWTHVHSGGVVKAGSKYIITGWMHFPHPQK